MAKFKIGSKAAYQSHRERMDMTHFLETAPGATKRRAVCGVTANRDKGGKPKMGGGFSTFHGRVIPVFIAASKVGFTRHAKRNPKGACPACKSYGYDDKPWKTYSVRV